MPAQADAELAPAEPVHEPDPNAYLLEDSTLDIAAVLGYDEPSATAHEDRRQGALLNNACSAPSALTSMPSPSPSDPRPVAPGIRKLL